MTRSLSPVTSRDPSRRYREIDGVAASRDRDIAADAHHALVEAPKLIDVWVIWPLTYVSPVWIHCHWNWLAPVPGRFVLVPFAPVTRSR
jgi:hypothetical protein